MSPVSEQIPARGAGYYIWPAVWVGARVEPLDMEGPHPIGFDRMADEVARVELDQGVVLRAYRDGLIVFDFRLATPRAGTPSRDFNHADIAVRSLARTQLLNAHLACLSTAVLTLMNFAIQPLSITTRDVLSFGDPDQQNVAFGAHSLAMPLYLARYPSTYPQALPNSFDWRIANRAFVISNDALEASAHLLRAVMLHPNEDLVPLADLLQRASTAVGDNNYPLAVVLAWTICEVILDRLWEAYLTANRERAVDGKKEPFIQGKRRERLRGDREYSASVRLEILSLVGVLPGPLYRDCDELRQARNGWLHDMKPVARDLAARAAATASAIIELRSDIKLRLGCGSGFHEQPAPPSQVTAR